MPIDPKYRDAINRVIEGTDDAALNPDVDEDGGIRIPAPKEPEVNPEVWRDVESLLFRGFLAIPAEINGVEFIFKSLNHHEYDHVQWLNGRTMNREATERFYNTFLAYGVFMVEGENILAERHRWLPELITTFGAFPSPAKQKVIRFMSEVNRRASNAVTLAEAFVMEATSRFRWAQLRGIDLMAPSCTGTQGTENLGLNYAQLVWRALNHYEDQKETGEREWDNAKFIGSCFAGKEIKKIYSQDTNRRLKEREMRMERRDSLLRQVLLGEDVEQEKEGKTVKFVARSVEELSQQLERDLRGEKDWHDQIVESEQRRMSNRITERREKLQQLVKEREEREGQTMRGAFSDSTEGLSKEEVQQRIQRRRQVEAQNVASRMVFPEMSDPRLDNFLAKYGYGEESTNQAGQQAPIQKSNQDPSTAMPVRPMPTRPRTPPFRR